MSNNGFFFGFTTSFRQQPFSVLVYFCTALVGHLSTKNGSNNIKDNAGTILWRFHSCRNEMLTYIYTMYIYCSLTCSSVFAQFVVLSPYSETCSDLRHSKLLQKSSVSKFIYSIVKCFFNIKILPFLFNIANVIFEVEMQYLGAKLLKSTKNVF
jgi:hypothetical protein